MTCELRTINTNGDINIYRKRARRNILIENTARNNYENKSVEDLWDNWKYTAFYSSLLLKIYLQWKIQKRNINGVCIVLHFKIN